MDCDVMGKTSSVYVVANFCDSIAGRLLTGQENLFLVCYYLILMIYAVCHDHKDGLAS